MSGINTRPTPPDQGKAMQKYSKINHEYKSVLVHFEEMDDLLDAKKAR